MTNRTTVCLLLAGLGAGIASAEELIAGDDFDTPVNLISYSAIDFEGNDPTNTGVWSSPRDNFGRRTMADRLSGSLSGNFLSETIVDASGGEDLFDTIGILPPDYPGGFFAIVDTDNGVNPNGFVEGLWTFDISGAAFLTTFELDIAAVGAFFNNEMGTFERFEWSYSIDGGPFEDLWTIGGDPSLGVVTYTLINGSSFSVAGNTEEPVDDNGASIDGEVILNQLMRVIEPIGGSGSELRLRIYGTVNDNNAGFVFDNIEIKGVSYCNLADYNTDDQRNASDVTAFRQDLNACSTDPAGQACQAADVNRDSTSDFFDATSILGSFGNCQP